MRGSQAPAMPKRAAPDAGNGGGAALAGVAPARHAMVELFGLPGAGKTTLLRALLPHLEAMGMDPAAAICPPVVPPGRRVLTGALGLAAGAAVAAPGAVAGFLARPGNWWLAMKLSYRAAGLDLRPGRAGALLVDSGILQPFVSFQVERNLGLRPVPVAPFLRRLALPAAAIYLRVSAATALGRWTAREAAAGRPRPSQNLEARFAGGFEICERLLAICRAGAVPTLVIDADAGVETKDLTAAARYIAGGRARGVPA